MLRGGRSTKHARFRMAARWPPSCTGLSMRLKVHGGTPMHNESSLCVTCRNARITRGQALNEELVICRASHVHAERIPFKVTACSAYSDEREPSYYELLQQAWILQPGDRSRPAGFVRATDLRDAEVDRFLAAMHEEDD